MFHSIVVTCLYMSNRSRPDISPTVSIMCGRVWDADKKDWEKLRRLVKYLACTEDLHLILRYYGLSLTRWHVYASFAMHEDFKSHPGDLLLLSEKHGL